MPNANSTILFLIEIHGYKMYYSGSKFNQQFNGTHPNSSNRWYYVAGLAGIEEMLRTQVYPCSIAANNGVPTYRVYTTQPPDRSNITIFKQ
jgi:hypothetical protein